MVGLRCTNFELLMTRELVDVDYPNAERIRVVQDNLSIHSAGSLYQAFPPAEARRVLRRLEFHYTPKHASPRWVKTRSRPFRPYVSFHQQRT